MTHPLQPYPPIPYPLRPYRPRIHQTTTLLTLARDLLEKKLDQESRIPAIFNLSSWTGESIEQWLVAELSSKYQIPQAIGQI